MRERVDTFLGVFVNSAVFLAIVTSLILKDGMDIGVGVLLLLAPLILWRSRAKFSLSPEELKLLAVILAYFTGCMISFGVEASDTRALGDLDLPFHFLFMIPVWFVLKEYRLNETLLWTSFSVAALGAASFSAYERFHLGGPVALGATNHHILFGGISMVMVSICFASFVAVKSLKHQLIALSGISFGIVASALSTSRGSWVAIFGLLMMHLVLSWKTPNRNRVAFLVSIVIGVLAMLVMLPDVGIIGRLLYAIRDIEMYFSGEQHVTSLGLRFEMWRGAFIVFKDNPWVGVGLEEYPAAIKKLQELGVIRTLSDMNMHPHNDILNALVNRGSVGGFTLLLLYFVPLAYFIKIIRSEREQQKQGFYFALAGVGVVLVFIIAGLSEALFDRNLSTIVYLFMVMIFYSQISIIYKTQPITVEDDCDKINVA